MKELDKKTLITMCIAIILIIVLVVVLIIVKLSNNSNFNNKIKDISEYTNADEIIIEDNDSNEMKEKKLQKKIELIDKDINEVQNKINNSSEKMNSLQMEYNNKFNQQQAENNATESTIVPESSEPTVVEEPVNTEAEIN